MLVDGDEPARFDQVTTGRAAPPREAPPTLRRAVPFPAGLTPTVPAASYATDPRAIAVAEAARRLVELRDRCLNPPEWVEWVDGPVRGYPKRPVNVSKVVVGV